jgi:SAM-dependent methyltransferase
VVGEGSDLDFEDDSFDTVLLGEVLEHLAAPDDILEETARVLRPSGRIVITTPFGLLHHHDHRQTFYPRPLIALIGSRFEILEATVEDGYFRIVAKNSPDARGASEEVLEGLMDASDRAVRSIQEALAGARKALLAKDKELAGKSAADAREKSDLRASIARLQAIDDMRRNALVELKAKNVQLAENMARLRTRVTDQRESIRALAGTVDRQRLRIEKLESDRWKLRNDLALVRWNLSSLKARKWWRLGVALARARRNPLLLHRAVGVVFGRSSIPPRPTPAPRPGAGSKTIESDTGDE